MLEPITPDPHDRFFKETFGRKENAVPFLQKVVPVDLTYLRTALTYLFTVSDDIHKTEFRMQIEKINDIHLREEQGHFIWLKVGRWPRWSPAFRRFWSESGPHKCGTPTITRQMKCP